MENKIDLKTDVVNDDLLKDLEQAGLTKISRKIKDIRSFQTKIDIAIKNFPLILTENHIKEFNEMLYKDTFKEDKKSIEYKRLKFTPISDYEKIPSQFVLERIKKAKDLNCFDEFEVCTIDWVKELKDPVVFGVISGTTDKFFITQWDNDITITELLEGKINNK